MKKTITLLLALMLLLGFTGCGSSGNNSQGENSQEQQNQQEPENENIEFKYGRVNNGVYENDIVGIGFRFDEYGLAEESMGAYRDRIPASEIAKNMRGTLVVELYCKNKELVDKDLNSLIFMQVTINVRESSEKVEEYMKNVMDSTLENYTSGKEIFAGYEINGNRKFSGQIGGRDFEGVELTIHDSVNLSNIVERRYFARYGQYIYRITFMASDSEYNSSADQLKREIEKLISGYFYKL